MRDIPCCMENLRTYIGAHPGRTNAEWAALLGVSRPHLHALLNGDRQPGMEVAQRIAAATSGAVPITSWSNIAALADAIRGAG